MYTFLMYVLYSSLFLHIHYSHYSFIYIICCLHSHVLAPLGCCQSACCPGSPAADLQADWPYPGPGGPVRSTGGALSSGGGAALVTAHD